MEDAGGFKQNRGTFIVPTIKSFDHYDFARAKIASSLTWLVAKAFGSGRCHFVVFPQVSRPALDVK